MNAGLVSDGQEQALRFFAIQVLKMYSPCLYASAFVADFPRAHLTKKEDEAMMWIMFAFASAFFAGITSILAKCGIKGTDSDVATAIRTVVVLAFSWFMALLSGSGKGIGEVEGKTWGFLVLSGMATGASWLCYFKALQTGDINKVVPIDKSSTVLTIVLAFLFLGEEVSAKKFVALFLIGAGTYLMIQKKEVPFSSGMGKKEASVSDGMQKKKIPPSGGKQINEKGKGWLLYACLSAVFASLTAILGKVGIQGIESNLGTAIRTTVVLFMAWLVVFVTGKQHMVRRIPGKELAFICLSGLATGASWLCYYKALQDGLASVVVPIDKLSILVTVGFSYVVFHEKLSRRGAAGLVMIVAGTLAML